MVIFHILYLYSFPSSGMENIPLFVMTLLLIIHMLTWNDNYGALASQGERKCLVFFLFVCFLLLSGQT